MAALLKFILIVFAVWQGFKLLMRFVFPFAMRKLAERLMKKAQQQAGSPFAGQEGPFQYQQQSQQQSQSRRSRNSGAVQVDFVPPKKTKFTGKGASTACEFVEFEEIK